MSPERKTFFRLLISPGLSNLISPWDRLPTVLTNPCVQATIPYVVWHRDLDPTQIRRYSRQLNLISSAFWNRSPTLLPRRPINERKDLSFDPIHLSPLRLYSPPSAILVFSTTSESRLSLLEKLRVFPTLPQGDCEGVVRLYLCPLRLYSPFCAMSFFAKRAAPCRTVVHDSSGEGGGSPLSCPVHPCIPSPPVASAGGRSC